MEEIFKINQYKMRYCVVCNKINEFNYDENIKHSRCKICGSGFGKKINMQYVKYLSIENKKLKEKLATFKDINKLNELIKENERYKLKIKHQTETIKGMIENKNALQRIKEIKKD